MLVEDDDRARTRRVSKFSILRSVQGRNKQQWIVSCAKREFPWRPIVAVVVWSFDRVSLSMKVLTDSHEPRYERTPPTFPHKIAIADRIISALWNKMVIPKPWHIPPSEFPRNSEDPFPVFAWHRIRHDISPTRSRWRATLTTFATIFWEWLPLQGSTCPQSNHEGFSDTSGRGTSCQIFYSHSLCSPPPFSLSLSFRESWLTKPGQWHHRGVASFSSTVHCKGVSHIHAHTTQTESGRPNYFFTIIKEQRYNITSKEIFWRNVFDSFLSCTTNDFKEYF